MHQPEEVLKEDVLVVEEVVERNAGLVMNFVSFQTILRKCVHVYVQFQFIDILNRLKRSSPQSTTLHLSGNRMRGRDVGDADAGQAISAILDELLTLRVSHRSMTASALAFNGLKHDRERDHMCGVRRNCQRERMWAAAPRVRDVCSLPALLSNSKSAGVLCLSSLHPHMPVRSLP